MATMRSLVLVRKNAPIQSAIGFLCGDSVHRLSVLSFERQRATMATTIQANQEELPLVSISETWRFITECLEAAGTPRKHAEAMADLLSEADHRGHFSHGMNRLEMYVNDIQSGMCDAKAVPEVLNETAASAWVDGKNGLGAVVGNFCMDLAIKKAKETGIGFVVAKGSNHYGIAGMYSLRAMKHDLLGFSCTNTSPFMCATRSKEAVLGTNPLALGAPAERGDSFLLDMATTAVAVGKIEIQRRKDAPIPQGWALDAQGKVTENAQNAMTARKLLPLGGEEINSGYKGYGLGMFVEILSSILSGATFGPFVRKWGDTTKPANLGQCFFAIDPKFFAPGFENRMSHLMNHIRDLEPIDPEKPIMVAGDPEKNHIKTVERNGGVRYVKDQIESCKRLSKALGVEMLKGK